GIPGRGRRPFIQRMFLPDSGPASIAVALPGSQNLAWDAGDCRLRYTWQGAFIDAGEHWRGIGATPATLPAEPWWRAGSARLLQVGDGTGEPVKAQFKGLRWLPDGASFEYLLAGVRVEERITPAKSGPGIA